eukprot:1151100-Pelagomonas_calceolata.AAC.1
MGLGKKSNSKKRVHALCWKERAQRYRLIWNCFTQCRPRQKKKRGMAVCVPQCLRVITKSGPLHAVICHKSWPVITKSGPLHAVICHKSWPVTRRGQLVACIAVTVLSILGSQLWSGASTLPMQVPLGFGPACTLALQVNHRRSFGVHVCVCEVRHTGNIIYLQFHALCACTKDMARMYHRSLFSEPHVPALGTLRAWAEDLMQTGDSCTCPRDLM